MSLQFRVLGSIAILLLLSLLCGGALLSLHARSVVEVEVRTAFLGAENSVRDTLQSDVQHTVTMRQVVSSFEGQRHVRAALVNEKGKVIVRSAIGRLTDPAPLLVRTADDAARHVGPLQHQPAAISLRGGTDQRSAQRDHGCLGPCPRCLYRHAPVLRRDHGGGVAGGGLCLALLPPLPDRAAGNLGRRL